MDQEGASSLLQFWLTAENFYNQLSSPQHQPDMEVATSDAIAIYTRLQSHALQSHALQSHAVYTHAKLRHAMHYFVPIFASKLFCCNYGCNANTLQAIDAANH